MLKKNKLQQKCNENAIKLITKIIENSKLSMQKENKDYFCTKNQRLENTSQCQ